MRILTWKIRLCGEKFSKVRNAGSMRCFVENAVFRVAERFQMPFCLVGTHGCGFFKRYL